MNSFLRLFLLILLTGNSIISFGQSLSTDLTDIVMADDTFFTQKRIAVDVENSSRKKVFVWQEKDAAGSSNKNIRCAVYSETMSLISSFIVNTTRTGDQMYPSIKVNQKDNSFIVTWSSWINNTNPSDSIKYDIYAKKIRFSSTTSDAATTDLLINSYINGRQIMPLIAFDYVRSEAVIAWIDQDGEDRLPTIVGNIDYGSFARRINTAGASLALISGAGQFQINVVVTDHQTVYAIDISPVTGELFTLCHSMYYSATTTYDIVLRKFTRGQDGNFIGGSESTINTYTSGNQLYPGVAINSKTGNVAIHWSDNGQDGSGYGTYLKIYDKFGNVLKTDTRINQAAYGNQLLSKVSWEENSNSLLCFYWYSESAMVNVRYQLFDKNFNYKGNEVAAESLNLHNFYTGVFGIAFEPGSKKVLLGYDSYQSGSDVPSKAWFKQFVYTSPAIIDTCNYVRTQVLSKDSITNEALVDGLSADEMMESTDYLDGLGNTIQTVIKQGSPVKNDIVTYKEYDAMGREDKSYLPYVSIENNGGFKASAKTEQSAFYTTNPDPTIAKTGSTNNITFSRTNFEASPYGRPVEQAMPGDAWAMGTNRTTTKTYSRISTYESIAQWQYDAATGNFWAYTTSALNWPANSLLVEETRDENPTYSGGTGPGAKIIEYKNSKGQVVLKKVQSGSNSSNYLLTYFIYDSFGQLVYTIPPEAVATAITKVNGYTPNDNFVKTWIVCYKYDAAKRVIEKRIPGAGWTCFFYDKLDRMVLSQDSVQRLTNNYSFVKYDALSRPIMTGACTISDPPATIRTNITNGSYLYESRSNAGGNLEGYTNVAYPTNITSSSILTVNYYDDYDFNSDGTSDYTYVTSGLPLEAAPFYRLAGQTTGSKTRILGNTTDWLIKIVFYDKKGRAIQTRGNSILNTNVQDITTNIYNFAGMIIRSKTVHTPGGTNPDITVVKRLRYDHTGRLKDVSQINNAGATVIVAEYKYNEIGQRIEKNLHKEANSYNYLQSVDYRFNIRGWITSINNSSLLANGTTNDDGNDIFGMNLGYETALSGLTVDPQFTGNVSAIKWKVNSTNGASSTKENSYVYTYDYASRLSKASFFEYTSPSWVSNTKFNENISQYDKNGNIKTLSRKDNAAAYLDSLTYTYDGNKLTKIDDASGNNAGFKDVAGIDYSYDGNGNMNSDVNKGITSITYNYLNLPIDITFSATKKVTYVYDAAGQKLKKTFIDGANTSITWYVNGFVYSGDNTSKKLSYFPTEEGRVIPLFSGSSITGFVFEYNITDHLGNVRVSFDKDPYTGNARVIQENHYYAFGGTMPGLSVAGFNTNKRLYTSQEFQDEPDLNLYDYNARFYDTYTGRFTTQDPHADSYLTSPYAYCINNPISYIDPTGMDPYKDNPYYGNPSDESSMVRDMHGIGKISDNWDNFDWDLYNSSTVFSSRLAYYDPFMWTKSGKTTTQIIADLINNTPNGHNSHSTYEYGVLTSFKVWKPTNPMDQLTIPSFSNNYSSSSNDGNWAGITQGNGGDGGGYVGAAALAAVSDGPLPIGDVIAVGILAYGAYKTFGNSKDWHYSYQHPSQNPIHNPPNGFNPDNFPDGNWKKWAAWTIASGWGYYQVKDAYNEQMRNINMPQIAPRDKTYVVPQFVPRHR